MRPSREGSWEWPAVQHNSMVGMSIVSKYWVFPKCLATSGKTQTVPNILLVFQDQINARTVNEARN